MIVRERSITKVHLAKENFVGVGAVDVRGVEEGDAGGDGMVDENDHVFIGLGRAVEGGHAHAAKSLSGDLEALRSQLDPPHYSCHCRITAVLVVLD